MNAIDLKFKEIIEGKKCATHNQSAQLIISDKGWKLKNVCCKDFEYELKNIVIESSGNGEIKELK